jgi:drug/metabolite transporter (DMT)-like permease
MLDDKLKNLLHLHFIVFIWGFTAILGKLITLQALDLVWFRMLFAVIFIFGYLIYKKEVLKIPKKTTAAFLLCGVVIAIHWFTFYESIKVSNISIALASLSTGAFFASILEPIFYKRKIIWYELFLGLLVIFGLLIIFKVETRYKTGIILGLSSAFLSAVFAIFNGKFAKKYSPMVISFYELGGGFLFLSFYLFINQKFTTNFFAISLSDLGWLLILSSVCTAYAFSASVKIMRFLSPYTVMLTINLEPVYGIVLAVLIFNDNEKMSAMFYFGALIILSTVIINGYLKNRK